MGIADWLTYTATIDGGHVTPTDEERKAEHQASLDAKAAAIGACMAILGTIIWAYGDLIGGLPK